MSTNANDLTPGMTGSGVVDLEADFLSGFGMGIDSGAEPPLGTDAPAGDKGAGAMKSDAGKGADPPSRKAAAEGDKEDKSNGAAKAGAEGDDGEAIEDEDLEAGGEEDEEEQAIKALPKEHQATLRRISKAAKFEDHVRNGTKSPKETVAYLKGISEARYNDISAEVVKDRLANVEHFIEKDLDDATYTKLATEMIKRDPAWVVKKITGRDGLKLSDLIDALDAKESGNKDSVVALPELDDATMDELATDYEEVADFLKAMKLARNGQLPKAFTSQLEAANAEIARLKAEAEGKGKTGDRTTKAGEEDEDDKAAPKVHADTPEIRKAVESDLGDYVEQQARDKDGLGLDVTDDERETAPEVAELKDTKLEEWVFGSTRKKVPSFLNGLMTHFKGNEKFMAQAKQVAYFADQGEKQNALLEGKKLRKYIDAYRKVRAELPNFKRLDSLIAKAAKEAGTAAPHIERHIPGGGSQTSSPASRKGQQATDDDIVNGFGLE